MNDTPLECEENTFKFGVANLFVPLQSIEKYKMATGWELNYDYSYKPMIELNTPMATYSYPTGFELSDVKGLLNEENTLKAYTVSSVGENSVGITEQTVLAANTGYILQGEIGEYFPLTTMTDAEQDGTNLLVPVVTSQHVDAVEGLDFVLYDSSFYPMPVGGSMPAHKAYLHLSSPNMAPKLAVSVDGDVTSIVAPTVENGGAEWYLLDGRRAVSPSRGLYIKNGKKVVVK